MAKVMLKNLNLSYPIISEKKSLRNFAVDNLLGGSLRKKDKSSDLVYIDALKGLDFEANDGDAIGIVGHNGAGKSTLLKVIAGLYQPTSGTIKVEGSVESLIDIGFGIDPEETGLENINFNFEVLNYPKNKIKNKVDEIVDFSELKDFIHMPVRSYSSGMSTRLSFGIATAVDPDILLIDEVIGTGDASFYQKAQKRLGELYKKTKILFLASHSNELIRQWCNKAMWLEKGEVKAFGDVTTIINRYKLSSGR